MRHGRRRRFGLVLAITALAAGSACSQTSLEPAPAPVDSSSRYTGVAGEYIVTLAAGADVNAIAELYGQFGIKGTQSLGQDIFLVTLARDPGVAKMEELRAKNAQITAVQPNFLYRGNGHGKIQ